MTFTIQNDYEEASEGAVRHWEIPYDRMEDQAPVITQPAAVTSQTAGTQVCGTILTLDPTGAVATSMAVVDFTCGMVYRQPVRNVVTYVPAAEATWRGMEIGDFVYYDGGATAIALDVKLTLAGTDSGVVANPLFGYIVPWDDTDAASFPKGDNTEGSTHDCAIMQIGAGAG